MQCPRLCTNTGNFFLEERYSRKELLIYSSSRGHLHLEVVPLLLKLLDAPAGLVHLVVEVEFHLLDSSGGLNCFADHLKGCFVELVLGFSETSV